MSIVRDTLSFSLRAGRWLVYRLLSLRDSGPILNYGIVCQGILSRSGRPELHMFRWLANQNVKTLVNLCGEFDEELEAQWAGLVYYHIPTQDGSFPTNEQASKFLRIVTNRSHWPVHVHCFAGAGRSGLMVALFRYAVEGWSVDEAIAESAEYFPGMTTIQLSWLRSWAKRYPPGSHGTAGL